MDILKEQVKALKNTKRRKAAEQSFDAKLADVYKDLSIEKMCAQLKAERNSLQHQYAALNEKIKAMSEDSQQNNRILENNVKLRKDIEQAKQQQRKLEEQVADLKMQLEEMKNKKVVVTSISPMAAAQSPVVQQPTTTSPFHQQQHQHHHQQFQQGIIDQLSSPRSQAREPMQQPSVSPNSSRQQQVQQQQLSQQQQQPEEKVATAPHQESVEHHQKPAPILTSTKSASDLAQEPSTTTTPLPAEQHIAASTAPVTSPPTPTSNAQIQALQEQVKGLQRQVSDLTKQLSVANKDLDASKIQLRVETHELKQQNEKLQHQIKSQQTFKKQMTRNTEQIQKIAILVKNLRMENEKTKKDCLASISAMNSDIKETEYMLNTITLLDPSAIQQMASAVAEAAAETQQQQQQLQQQQQHSTPQPPETPEKKDKLKVQEHSYVMETVSPSYQNQLPMELDVAEVIRRKFDSLTYAKLQEKVIRELGLDNYYEAYGNASMNPTKRGELKLSVPGKLFQAPTFKPKWIVITIAGISVYADHTERMLEERRSVEEAVLLINRQKEAVFTVRTKQATAINKDFQFMCDSKEARSEWISFLTHILKTRVRQRKI